MKSLLALTAAAAVVLTATPALAGKGEKGPDKHWKNSDQRYEQNRYERDRHGYNEINRNCPPGLRKKNNGCMPPGQARRSWREGQRVTSNYRYYTPYNDLPLSYRNQYDLDRDNRYIYQNGTIYQVDPTTNIVERVLRGLLR